MPDEPRAILCPYCGDAQAPTLCCRSCGGNFDRWSLAATQNDMGSWQLRNSSRPHFIGLSYEAMVAAIRDGEVGMNSIVRGPTTRQFWTLARRAPGIAHLFGRCHSCQAPVTPSSPACSGCGASATAPSDRNFVGLPEIETVTTPADAVSDLSGFIEDSGVLLVRVAAVEQPRVAPAPVPAPVKSPAAAASPEPTPKSEPEPLAPRGGVSIVARALADRSRKLERTNRALFAALLAATLGAIVMFGLLFDRLEQTRRLEALLRQRDAELAKANAVKVDTERKAPVTNTPKPELPSEPETPRTKP